MTQARYLTAFSNGERGLVRRIKSFFEELGASYEPNFEVNPLNNRRVAQAEVNQNFEFTLTISWTSLAPSPIQLTFDVESVADIYLANLHDLIAIPAEPYFGRLDLIYDSGGRSRDLETFPYLFDLESVIREMIISRMLATYGIDWWDTAQIDPKLTKKAEDNRNNEIGNPLHDYFEFHPIFYLDLRDLRKIIEDQSNRPAPHNKIFSDLFAHYDQVHIPDKIGEIRDLRNRVMHGKYLTESNKSAIQVICGQFHRFLISQGHVGDFKNRKLINP